MNNNSFAVFIMVWGRPDKDWTYKTLRRHGYTGKIYLVADDLDKTAPTYKEIYGDELLIFSKEEVASKYDHGDNSGDLRSTLFSSNTIKHLARELGIKHFMIMCDDYLAFSYRFNSHYRYDHSPVRNLDKVFDAMIDFYKKTPTTTIALSQGGDFMGGDTGSYGKAIKLTRKAMNSFLCSTDRPFDFMGRVNEDVTTYVNLGSKGYLFFTTNLVSLNQTIHQSESAGLTDMYLDYGTYVKSFMSVMYNPSSIRVSTLKQKHERVHHKIDWRSAVPKIIREEYKKI